MSKRFDICLGQTRYLQQKGILDKLNELSDKTISLSASNMLHRPSNKMINRYGNIIDKYLISAEEFNNDYRDKYNIDVSAIFVFDRNKKEDTDINIKYGIGTDKEINIKKLTDIEVYDDIDEEIFKYLKNDNINKYFNLLSKNQDKNKSPEKIIDNFIKKHDNKIYLVTNGNVSKTYLLNSNTGKIFDNKEDLKQYFINRNGGLINIFLFDTIKEAENCRKALELDLFRYILIKTHHFMIISKGSLELIPDIDWSNDKSTTIEGILKLCNVPNDKIDFYIKHIKDTINEFDSYNKK